MLCLPVSFHMSRMPSLKVMGARHTYMHTHTSNHIISNCHISKVLMLSSSVYAWGTPGDGLCLVGDW